MRLQILKKKKIEARLREEVDELKATLSKKYAASVSVREKYVQERFDWEQKEIKRMNEKDAKKQTLLETKEIRHMERTEKNFLRTLDVAENLEHQRRLKQQKQDYIYKKEYLKNAYNKEV